LRLTTGIPGEPFSACSGSLTLSSGAVLDLGFVFGNSHDAPIPAHSAFDAGCNSSDLGDDTDLSRSDPIWAPLLKDPDHPFPNDPPVIFEGRVTTPQEQFGVDRTGRVNEHTNSQAPSEVSEFDLSWNHYTHDKTFQAIPDPRYKYLLAGDRSGAAVKPWLEVEWEEGSTMGDSRTWGALPEFAWPSVGDRIWTEGRWVFDCGHTGLPGGDIIDPLAVRYETEIHPPRALVTFRLNHPVAGPPTEVPVTEADVYVSGNGGGANDICSVYLAASIVYPNGYNICTHTGPSIPVNDRNYVFDIYPPGTNFNNPLSNGTFPVTPPTSDAVLQWRTIDQSSQIPEHSGNTTVTPIFCPIDASTPPPDQTETSCPTIRKQPTRLRVILPFATTNANVFAQSILVGWDDVPRPPDPPMRTFDVRLHELTVIHNGESFLHDGDWRVFVDVAGQWRYISNSFDRNPDGSNSCQGDSLTENGDDDCFRFDNLPWRVTIPDGMRIHIAVGGYESDVQDSDFCRTLSGCQFSAGQAFDLFAFLDDRIGTLEFDLNPEDNYQSAMPGSSGHADYTPPLTFTTERLNSIPGNESADGTQYQVTFSVQEVKADLVPTEPEGSVRFCKSVNNQLQVVVRVENQGGAFAPASITKVDFFSFGSVDVPTLGISPGEFIDLGPIKPPAGCFNPNCQFRITVDSGNSVDESDQENNSANGVCIG
jgi:CARDB